jgi:hypothetical protein
MKNKISSLLITLILFSTVIFIFSIDKASAHVKKNHKPIICVLEKDRTPGQKKNCRFWRKQHRLCKLDIHCAVIKMKEQEQEIIDKGKEIIDKDQEIIDKEKEIIDLEEKLGGTAFCIDIPFNYKASSATKVYQKPDRESKVIANIKKDQEFLFFAASQKNKNWYYIKVRKDVGCADGYIEQKYVIKKEVEDEDVAVIVGPKLIKIIDHKWKIQDKLILIDAEGTASITGAVQEGKIDQIIVNEEEELINSDNTFTHLLFVPTSGAEVRIIGNKNGKKVKELIFTIKVGK